MKPKRTKKTGVSPMEAKNNEICRITNECYQTEWFNIESYPTRDVVEIIKITKCGFPQSSIIIPRPTFNKLIRWYQTEQKFVRK